MLCGEGGERDADAEMQSYISISAPLSIGKNQGKYLI